MKNELNLNQRNTKKTNPCAICAALGNTGPCNGHGGTGGGSSGSESSEQDTQKANTLYSGAKIESFSIPQKNIDNMDTAAEQTVTQNILLMQMSISALLANNILTIDNNRDTSILRISWNVLPPDDINTKIQLENFISAILTELNHFNVSSDCLRIKKGDVQIQLSPNLYDQFIQHLAAKELLPDTVVKQQPGERIKHSKDIGQSEKLTFDEDQFTIRPRSPIDTKFTRS